MYKRQILGLIEFGNTTDDGALLHTIVDQEAEQLVGLGDAVAFNDSCLLYTSRCV